MSEQERDGWREMLEPPAGGLARLIGAVEAQRTAVPWRLRRLALAGAGAMVAFGLAFGLFLHRSQDTPEYRIRQAIEAALLPAAGLPKVSVENGAALEMPSANPNVRIYWIAQMSAGEEAAERGAPASVP